LIDKAIGRRIREIRKRWGLSQIELAEKVGLSFQQIQKYEKGSTRISVMRLKQISDALGVNILSLLEQVETDLKVSDSISKYTLGKSPLETLQPMTKEERTLLKLFRKITNRKVKEGIIRQLEGVIELEEGK